MLVAIRRDYTSSRYRWIAKCDCGETTSVNWSSVRSGTTFCCGCMRRKNGKIVGALKRRPSLRHKRVEPNESHGDLTAVEPDKTKQGGFWIARCRCGKLKSVRWAHVRSGEIKSCGCRRQLVRGQDPASVTWIEMPFGKMVPLADAVLTAQLAGFVILPSQLKERIQEGENPWTHSEFAALRRYALGVESDKQRLRKQIVDDPRVTYENWD